MSNWLQPPIVPFWSICTIFPSRSAETRSLHQYGEPIPGCPCRYETTRVPSLSCWSCDGRPQTQTSLSNGWPVQLGMRLLCEQLQSIAVPKPIMMNPLKCEPFSIWSALIIFSLAQTTYNCRVLARDKPEKNQWSEMSASLILSLIRSFSGCRFHSHRKRALSEGN